MYIVKIAFNGSEKNVADFFLHYGPAAVSNHDLSMWVVFHFSGEENKTVYLFKNACVGKKYFKHTTKLRVLRIKCANVVYWIVFRGVPVCVFQSFYRAWLNDCKKRRGGKNKVASGHFAFT